MARFNSRATMLGATMLTGFTATAAAAQATAPADPADRSAPAGQQAAADSNEIVVTGSRRRTTLQDAPINISAVTGDTLAKQRIDDVRGLAAFTPGVTVTDTGPASTGNIILRGINSGDTSDTGSNVNNSIGVYLGEVPLYVDFKLIDIARVEVLQGPQGTLYGLGTLAGAVRYIPNRPDTDKFSVDLHARGYAESHSGDLGGVGDVAINVPIIGDHVAFRTATGYFDNAGFIDYSYILKQPGVSDPQPGRSTTPGTGSFGTSADYTANFRAKKDINYEHTFTTRNQLLLEYNPNLRLTLTYAHQSTKTGGRQANADGVLGTGRYEGPFRYEEPFKRVANLYSGELEANLFGIAQLVATTAYTTQNNHNTDDNTDLLLDLNYGYEAFPQFSSFANNHQTYKQFNEEIRLVSTHGGPINWVIGGFYNRLRFTSSRQEYTPGFAAFAGIPRSDDSEYISFVNQKNVEKAVYGEATLHVTNAWQVTGGIRYYKYDVDSTGGSDLPLLAGKRVPDPLDPNFINNFAPNRIKSGTTGADGVVFKANTSYKFSPDLLVYGTYSTGYRVGGVNRVPACTAGDLANIAAGKQALCALPNELFYGPDRTRNMEIGVRAGLFDKRVEFTLAGFRVNWRGIQVPSSTVNGSIGIIKNASTARSQGFDFTGTVKVTPAFLLLGSYSYVDAHLTGLAPSLVVVQDPPTGPNMIDGEPGDRLPGSTKNSGSLQAIYTYPLGDGRTIEVNYAAAYTGSIYSRVGLRGFGTRIPGYVTHRVALTYRTDKLEAGLFADNISDKYAVTSVGNDQSSLFRIRTDVAERYYAQSVLTPRRVGVELRYHY